MFIELSDGYSVNTEDIKAVESTATGSLVHTSLGSFPTAFPYRLFLSLIKQDEVEETKEVKLEPKAMDALNSLGHHFAG